MGKNTTVKNLLDRTPIDFGGGCSQSKADMFYFLITKLNVKVSVDIGVYRGRSLLPQSLAHKHKKSGLAYGVDPYRNDLVAEKDNLELKDKIDDFIRNTDFNEIRKDVGKIIREEGLSSSTKMLRMTSANAYKYLMNNNVRPGFVHIDVNHDTEIVTKDVTQYSSLLTEEGVIVIDDISWTSVKPAVNAIESLGFKLLFCRVDEQNDYAVFTNNMSDRKNKKMASLLYKFGQY